jgi:tetratricopeptide (TPR) repeat protein
VINRNTVFFSLVFIAWLSVMTVRYGYHSYYNKPLPSLKIGRGSRAYLQKSQIATQSMNELRDALKTEDDPRERMNIYHNIGIAFFDKYSTMKEVKNLLDSAIIYMERSIFDRPDIERFYYNLGRVYAEIGNHEKALHHYERAIELNPKHILALHNLGMLYYAGLHKKEKAEYYLDKVAAIDSTLPICFYVLGEIALDTKENDLARRLFEKELQNTADIAAVQRRLPIRRASIVFARTMAHLQLSLIYSRDFPNKKSAQKHFNTYLKLETNNKRKTMAMKTMKKYWKFEK